MPKSKQPEDSVLNDNALDIDIKGADVEVIASDVKVANDAVTATAVIKNNKDEKAKLDTNIQQNGDTKVFEGRVADALSTDEKDNEEGDFDAVQKTKDLVDEATKKLDNVKTDTKEALDEAKDAFDKAKVGAKNALDEAKDYASDAAKNITADAKDALDAVRDAEDGNKSSLFSKALGSLQALGDNAKQSLEDAKKLAKDKLDTTKDDGANLVDDAKEAASDAKDAFTQKAQDVKDALEDEAGGQTQKAQSLVDKLKCKLSATKTKAKDTLDEVKHSAEDKLLDAKDKLQDSKDVLLQKTDILKQKADTLKQDTVQLAEQKKASLVQAQDGVTDSFNQLKCDIARVHSDAKTAAAQYADTHDDSGASCAIGKLGAYLSSVYQNGMQNAAAVDIHASEFKKDAFRQQSSDFVRQIFGSKGVAATSFASKVLPEDKLEGINTAIYGRLATFASAWALKDLKSDDRFAQLSQLSASQKQEFASDVSNKNRVLATAGGLSAFLGLKGVVVDTAWLLAISLKSIYQIAAIYNKPLTGKDGAKIAYGVLAGANLDKLQEKQIIATALALGDMVLDNAQSSGLNAELKRLGERYQASSYAKSLDEVFKYIDLDRFNKAWVHHILPLASSFINAHYNNELLEQVLSVTKASFADKPQALLEDKTDANVVLGAVKNNTDVSDDATA